jgi:signal transduction histidine kinase
MPDIDPFLTLHIFGIFIYLVLIVVTIRQRGFQDTVARWLSAYIGVSLALEIGNLVLATNQISSLPDIVFPHLGLYGNLVRAIFLLHLSVLFFRRVTDWFWLSLGIFSLSVILLLEYSWFSSPFIIKLSSRWIITGISMVEAGLITCWGILMFRTIWRTIRAYRQGTIIITKPRITYWSIGLILVLLGDIFSILNFRLPGGSAKFLGAVIVSYIVLTTRLPDIKGVFKQLISIFFGALLELLIYTVGIVLLQTIFGNFLGFQPVISGLIFGLIFLIILNPFTRLLKKWNHKLFFGEKLDFDQILSDFSQKINHALDLNSLSSVIVDTIGKWIDVETGTLFTVDSDITENSQRRYRLVNVQKSRGETHSPGFLASESPITHRFTQEKKTLTNTEIEGSPEFQSAGVGEYTWFRNQKMEIFIPIYGMDEWIGLLALGAKSSVAPYTESDIRLLERLGDLIAIGLENARLVESVVRVNNEFRRAYSAMDDAHTKLKRLDQSKSDFINIASHELRTPLTVVSGYNQMLSEDPIFNESDFYNKVIKGINDGTKRLYEIVDSMLDVAKIDTRALELNTESIDIENLIQNIYTDFRDAIQHRNLIFTFYDLKIFPPVIGDPEALNKVFYHLFSNAIKYTPDGGKISVSGSIITEDDDRFIGSGIEIVISDTGIGIDPRFKELIFSKFYQTGELVLHSGGKTKFKGGGPGLGLAIVRGIVQAHGGRVWAESTGYDEKNLPGSHFHIILPTEPDVSLIS